MSVNTTSNTIQTKNTKNTKISREPSRFDRCCRRVMTSAKKLATINPRLNENLSFTEIWKRKKNIDEYFEEVVELQSLARFHRRTIPECVKEKMDFITAKYTTACRLINLILEKNENVIQLNNI